MNKKTPFFKRFTSNSYEINTIILLEAFIGCIFTFIIALIDIFMNILLHRLSIKKMRG